MEESDLKSTRVCEITLFASGKLKAFE